MFPVGPRRPMPRNSPFSPRRPLPRQQNSTKLNLMSLLQDPEGNFDFERISKTAHHINKIYSQASPLITRFIKK